MANWFDIGAGSVGGLAGIVSTAMTNQANIQMNRETNQARQALAEWQNQQNIEQWRRETAYNTPSAQMERLRAAGLNPSIMMTQGDVVNEAAPSPQMTSAAGSLTTPHIQSPMDPLTASQVALNMSQARKNDSENEYQQYMNAVERELSHLPLRSVAVQDDNGNTDYRVEYGNARVELTKTDLDVLHTSSQGLKYQLADLFFDLAVKTGSYDFNSGVTYMDPLSSESGQKEMVALRGDRHVRELAGQMAQIGYEAAQAEKAGKEAYANWLKDHKDDPVVKLALTLQGFLQSIGFTFPSISHREGGYYSGGQFHPTSRSWYFGN